jgi:hypothetical protein
MLNKNAPIFKYYKLNKKRNDFEAYRGKQLVKQMRCRYGLPEMDFDMYFYYTGDYKISPFKPTDQDL